MEQKEFKGLEGTGILAIWSDAGAEHEEEFNNWYTNQHLLERVGIPGFRRGRRYMKDAPGTLKYFTLYETDDVKVLESEPYLERLNDPTDWTRRALPFFKNGSRAAMALVSSTGRGVGGFAATIEFSRLAGSEAELRDWVASAGEAALKEHPQLNGWHLFETDDDVTRAKAGTAEAQVGRPAGSGAPPPAPVAPPAARSMLMVESTDRKALDLVGEILQGNEGLGAHGATDVAQFNIYQLMLSLA